MSTAMEKTQPPPQMLTYAQLFSTKESTRIQVKKAAARLGYVTGRVLEPMLLEGWAQNLETYSPSLLQAAFERVEREVAAFPAVSHIIQILDRAEFDSYFALVIKGLRRHGYDWQDREAWRECDKWDWHSPEALAHPDGRINLGGKIHAAEPAPAIPARMLKALELFGGEDDFKIGLRRLYRDWPGYWDGDTVRDTGQHSRQAALIEKDLLACWLRSQ